MTNTMSCGCEIISDNLGAYKIEYCPKHKAVDDMYEALKEIAEGKGRFSLDNFTHARNTIEDMKELANEALAKAGEICIP